MIKYSCLMMIVLYSAMSYAAEPPPATTFVRIKYAPEELVAYSPPHTPIPDKERLLTLLAAKKKGALYSSIDSSSDVADKMKTFCDDHPLDAQKIAPAVTNKLSKSTSCLERKPDESV